MDDSAAARYVRMINGQATKKDIMEFDKNHKAMRKKEDAANSQYT